MSRCHNLDHEFAHRDGRVANTEDRGVVDEEAYGHRIA